MASGYFDSRSSWTDASRVFGSGLRRLRITSSNRACCARRIDDTHTHAAVNAALMIIRGASPLGLLRTLSRSPLRRLAPFAWLARDARSHVASTTLSAGCIGLRDSF